ncbi:hypothetical protein Tsubulata_039875 [Turnera subulata]|uniref:RING-type E3 ubiquitin transferase n=1 Tax=Turnera subulata TaxID=218843 RepID=A0A9Q0FHF4_9ROSI|nr:hypothetical protein Tsubulata_039875 [Turnera subulata]
MGNNTTTPSSKGLTPHDHNYPINGKIMLCSVIVFFAAVLVMFCFHTYSRWLSSRNSSSRRRRGSAHHLAARGTAPQGLDLSILKALPTFVYNSKTHDPLQECSVCLSEFQENEKGRVLPQCKHTFHVDCIDMWFHSHSNCPLCRASVQPGNTTEIRVDVGTVPAGEPAGSVPGLGEKKEYEIGSSSSGSSASLSPVECRRKPLELVGIIVEVPSKEQGRGGLVDLGLGSPEQNGPKSPGNRALSLKRIWSI